MRANHGSIQQRPDSFGSIDDDLAQGFFVNDTRLISYYEVSINRDRLLLLASSPINYHSALYQFTNSTLRTINGTLPQGQLMVRLHRNIADGMQEEIDITNHHSEPVEFQLMLAIRSDFADIFEVKAKQVLTRGETETTWAGGALTTEYRNGSFYRSLRILPERSSSQCLFQPDLWCGWGIRTLSSLNPAYNPISYQLGSV